MYRHGMAAQCKGFSGRHGPPGVDARRCRVHSIGACCWPGAAASHGVECNDTVHNAQDATPVMDGSHVRCYLAVSCRIDLFCMTGPFSLALPSLSGNAPSRCTQKISNCSRTAQRLGTPVHQTCQNIEAIINATRTRHGMLPTRRTGNTPPAQMSKATKTPRVTTALWALFWAPGNSARLIRAKQSG